jgi:tRNA G10  N-methylase Trm11
MQTIPSCLVISSERRHELPAAFCNDDVRFSDAFAEHVVRRFSQAGDVVFDPFAGFGTTLLAAEALGRDAYGVEFDERRVRYVRGLLSHPERLLHGDSRRLADYALPPIDLSLTSPPYMQRNDPEDPFTSYTLPGRGYAAYLETIQGIYAQMRTLMRPGARALVEAVNLPGEGGITTLAWDIAAAVGEVLTYEGEIVVVWKPSFGPGYDHSYCLVFRKPE